MDAASKGASNGTQIVLGIIASVLAFLAFVYWIDGILGWLGELVGKIFHILINYLFDIIYYNKLKFI